MPTLNGANNASRSRQVSSVWAPKPSVLMLYAYQSQCCRALLSTKPHCSSSSQMRATSVWVTGEDVIRFGESFSECGNGIDSDFQHSCSIRNASAVESHFGNVLFNAGFSGLLSIHEQKYPMAFAASKAVTTFRILSVTVNQN